MKCLIVTNGTDFKIKYKWLFFWIYLKREWVHCFEPHTNIPFNEIIRFRTLEDTLNFLKNNYGTSHELMNTYHFVAAQIK